MIPLCTTTSVAGAVGVRVRVLLGGAAVGGPARVADADACPSTGCSRRSASRFLMRPAARRICSPSGAEHRDARRVIAAVLERLEPVEDDVDRALVPDIADDSAHGVGSSCLGFLAFCFARGPALVASPAGRAPPRARPGGTSLVITEPAAT